MKFATTMKRARVQSDIFGAHRPNGDSQSSYDRDDDDDDESLRLPYSTDPHDTGYDGHGAYMQPLFHKLSSSMGALSVFDSSSSDASYMSGVQRRAQAQAAAPHLRVPTRLSKPPLPTVVRAGAWTHMFDQLRTRYSKRRDEEFNATRIVGKNETAHQDLYETPRASGRDRYESIQNSLNDMGLIREKHQIQFHNSVLDACVQHIYGADYVQCLEEIFARLGTNEIRQEILVQTPRRFGKTTMVAMIVAALAAFVPGIKIGIFSTSKETSQRLMEEVKRFLRCIAGTAGRILRENMQTLWLSEKPIRDAKEKNRREKE